MSSDAARSAMLRTLSFHEAWGYAPTRAELMLTLDTSGVPVGREEVSPALGSLCADGTLAEDGGRIGFSGPIPRLVAEIRERDPLQPRKRRRARLVARHLSYLPGVRFVALANTTALGNARDEGDLDFFVIARAGTIWMTRLLSVLPFKLLGWMPTAENSRDAVCLSYFIADDALELSSHLLKPDDPYFRYWFLSLLPLYDDGVSRELWDRNAVLRFRHPFAEKWICPPDLRIKQPVCRVPSVICRVFEPLAKALQMRWFPQSIRTSMNNDTRVIVSDQALKFHVTDNREQYRDTYYALCNTHGIDP